MRRQTFKILLSVVLMLALTENMYSTRLYGRQDHKKKEYILRGMVTDIKGEAMPGVTVREGKTSNGTSTNIDGEFHMKLKGVGQKIFFSFIGKKTHSIVFTGQQYVKIEMEDEANKMEEVVVTGYFNTTLRKETGSVAVVPEVVFKNKAITGIDNLLKGEVAGIKVTSSGRPGSTASIRIRGTNTISGNAEPLWVIDGVPMQNNINPIQNEQIKSGDFNSIFINGIGNINPNDIASVTILKDASATAIYGSRASGGVIVVTTKKGKSGKINVSLSSNMSMQMKPQRDGGLMNTQQKLAWEKELWNEFSEKGFEKNEYYPVVGIVGMLNSGWIGKNGILKDQSGYVGMTQEEREAYINTMGGTSTNWFNEIFHNSFSVSNHISLSGGQEAVKYYISLGNNTNNGLLKKTTYDRYSLMGNLDIQANERLKIGLGFDISQQESGGSSLNVNPFQYAYFANPYERPYNDDGSYRPDMTWTNAARANGNTRTVYPLNGFNIMREMDNTYNETKNRFISTRLNLNYSITDKLLFSGLASYTYTSNSSESVNGKDTYAAFQDRLSFSQRNPKDIYGSIMQSTSENSSYNVRGQLSWNDVIGGGNSRYNILLGAEIRGSKSKGIYSKRYGYDPVTGLSNMPVPPKSSNIKYEELINLAKVINFTSGDNIDEQRFASFYGAINYSLNDKYMFSTSIRTDGSNDFGSKQQFNPTWSLGFAWHMGEEDFMYQFKHIISHLKWSFAGGLTGNVNREVKPEIIMQYQNKLRRINSDGDRIGDVLKAPNPNLRWEKTGDFKIAMDMGLFENKINLLLEAYYRKGVDLVTSVSIPYVAGFSNQMFNTSEIINKGIEATVRARILDRNDYRINVSANMAYNINELSKYESPNSMSSGRYVGYPLSSVFSGKYKGIDPNTGLYTFYLRPDANILKVSDFTDMDNYIFYLGTKNAPVTGGFNVNMSYKNISLSVSGNYSLGGKIKDEMNYPVTYGTVGSGTGEAVPTAYNDLYLNFLNRPTDAINRWTKDRKSGMKYPRIIDFYGDKLGLDSRNPSYSYITDGAIIKDISFLKISNITISYELPAKLLKKTFLSSAGVHFSLNNLFTFTAYEGLDPENPGATYPLSRMASLGINVSF